MCLPTNPNRRLLENDSRFFSFTWILDPYKEKQPKDSAIAKLFNTYKFADYKEQMVDLLDRVCTVSVKTIEIVQQLPDTVEHKGDNAP